MFKKYRIKYVYNGMYILEFCFRRRKKELCELHRARVIQITSCILAERNAFWYCLTNQRFILN